MKYKRLFTDFDCKVLNCFVDGCFKKEDIATFLNLKKQVVINSFYKVRKTVNTLLGRPNIKTDTELYMFLLKRRDLLFHSRYDIDSNGNLILLCERLPHGIEGEFDKKLNLWRVVWSGD